MAKNKFWIESFFNYFPVDFNNTSKQLLLRFSFLFLLWFSGLIIFFIDGLSEQFLSNYSLYTNIFVTNFIILFGTRWVQFSLNSLIPKLRPIFTISDSEFNKFSEKLTRIRFNVFPILVIALFFSVIQLGGSSVIQTMLNGGIQLYLIWELIFYVFSFLLIGTAYWMLASIWLTIFLVSRQSIEIQLFAEPNEQFRSLSKLALTFALFYFISITVSILSSPIVLSYPFSITEMLFAPQTIYILIGILGVLFPFYNIHAALLKLKRKQINKIDVESNNLMNNLDESIKLPQTNESNRQIIITMAQLYKIQLNKKQMESASEWPIDITFLSRFVGVILIPVVARIFLELINQPV